MAGDLGNGATAQSDQRIRAFSVLKTPMMEIQGVRLDAPAEASAVLWRLLSHDERARAERFRYARDRQHYVVARAGLRQLLGERLHIAPRAVEFVETKYGKPKLAPLYGAAGVEFNVSHSGGLALYVIASGSPVGIDIELVREVPDAGYLAQSFFSAAESASLRTFPLERRSLAFLACWTRKEALVKALGLGLSCPLGAFDVTIDPDTPARITRMDECIGRAEHWAMRAFTPYPGYIAAVAYRR